MRAYMRSAFAAATAAHEGFTNVHKQAFMWNVASALLVLCNGCWQQGNKRQHRKCLVSIESVLYRDVIAAGCWRRLMFNQRAQKLTHTY
jgi:hypothetical protein